MLYRAGKPSRCPHKNDCPIGFATTAVTNMARHLFLAHGTKLNRMSRCSICGEDFKSHFMTEHFNRCKQLHSPGDVNDPSEESASKYESDSDSDSDGKEDWLAKASRPGVLNTKRWLKPFISVMVVESRPVDSLHLKKITYYKKVCKEES